MNVSQQDRYNHHQVDLLVFSPATPQTHFDFLRDDSAEEAALKRSLGDKTSQKITKH